MEEVRKDNPEFAKLIDCITSTYQEDGTPKSTLLQLKQAESRLQSVRQSYLEQKLLMDELTESLSALPPPSHSHHRSEAAASSADMSAAAELQHCLDIAPETTLLGLQSVHLKYAAEGVATGNRTTRIPKQAVQESLEQRLKEKCLRVAHWHMPVRDVATSDSDLRLAKVGQLPVLLSQQKKETERFQEDLKEHERKRREMTSEKLKVLREMCIEMKHTLEQHKLVLTARANTTSLEYLQVKCKAMSGKLDVMHHQLMKGICSDGRLQALKEIRSHLLTAQRRLTEELTQTQHVVHNYQSLGEEFAVLSQQYREIKGEIENKEWALEELSKTRA